MKNFNIKEEFLKKYGDDNSNYVPYEPDFVNNDDSVKPIWYYLDTEEGKRQMLDEINTIMDFIEFDKIHDTMVTLNWKWSLIDPNNPPSVTIIKEQLLNLLCELFEDGSNKEKNENGKRYKISTGGFTVGFECYAPEDNEPDDFAHCVNVHVDFAIESYDSLY